MTLLVGTSGWQYADWRGTVYPPGLPQRLWFEHLLTGFQTVELNGSFYRLPTRATTTSWHDRAPADAVLAVKASRYLTHVKRLRDPEEPVARLLDRLEPLGRLLGPVLLQLPPDLRVDPAALAEVLARFPAPLRVAVEPRHPSWFAGRPGAEVSAVLRARNAALVWSDRRGRRQAPLLRTAEWGYVRLHEGRASPWPRYGRRALAGWAARLAAAYEPGAPVFVYFNNDPGGAAVANAVTFAGEARRRGLAVSRVPDRRRHRSAGPTG